MKYFKIFVFLLCASIVLSGCEIIAERNREAAEAQNSNQDENPPFDVPAPSEPQQDSRLYMCTSNAGCSDDRVCVDGLCRELNEATTLTDECTSICTVREVVMDTDDGQFTLTPGRGSYTGAGALEWKIERSQYCEDETPHVPVLISLRNYGKLIDEYYIVLLEGQTSQVLTHPTITSIQFELTPTKITSECEISS